MDDDFAPHIVLGLEQEASQQPAGSRQDSLVTAEDMTVSRHQVHVCKVQDEVWVEVADAGGGAQADALLHFVTAGSLPGVRVIKGKLFLVFLFIF